MDQTITITSNDVVVPRQYLEILERHYRDCPQVDQEARAILRNWSASPRPPGEPISKTSKKRKRVDTYRGSFVENSPKSSNRLEKEIEYVGSFESCPATFSCPQRPKEPISKTSKTKEGVDTHWEFFVRNSPKASNWHKKEIELVGSVENFDSHLRSIAGENGEITNTSVGNEPSGRGLVAIGIQLAQSTTSLLENARCQTAFSYFQLLVVSSYCAFLETSDVSRDEIDRILQRLTTIRQCNRRRLPKRAARIHLFICKLVEGGWPINRATELFILNALAPKRLLGIRDESFRADPFLGREYLDCDFENCFPIEFSIPMLIKRRLDQYDPANEFSIEQISANIVRVLKDSTASGTKPSTTSPSFPAAENASDFQQGKDIHVGLQVVDQAGIVGAMHAMQSLGIATNERASDVGPTTAESPLQQALLTPLPSNPIDYQSPPSMGLEVVRADTSASMADVGIQSSSEKVVNDGVGSELLPSIAQHGFGTGQNGCQVADFTYASDILEHLDDNVLIAFNLSRDI